MSRVPKANLDSGQEVAMRELLGLGIDKIFLEAFQKVWFVSSEEGGQFQLMEFKLH